MEKPTSKRKKKLSSIVTADVKLDSEFCFSFLWHEHCHSKIPGAWLREYASITVLF